MLADNPEHDRTCETSKALNTCNALVGDEVGDSEGLEVGGGVDGIDVGLELGL
jgi:hypothetical protein